MAVLRLRQEHSLTTEASGGLGTPYTHTAPHHHHTLTCCKRGRNSFVLVRPSAKLPCPCNLGSTRLWNVGVMVPSFSCPEGPWEDRCADECRLPH